MRHSQAAQESEHLRQNGFDFGAGFDEGEDVFQKVGDVAQDVVVAPPPRMRGVQGEEQPVSGQVAAKFEDNPEYTRLMQEWEAKAAEDKPQKPKGSLAAALADYAAALQKRAQEQALLEGQGDVKLIGRDIQAHKADGVGDEFLEVAE